MLNTIGPYSERDLAEKLSRISEAEMQAYNRQRERKIQLWYVFTVIAGILGIILWAVKQSILSIVITIVGIVLFRIAWYEKVKWRRLYQNLLYLKRKREKDDQEARESDHSKFRSLDKSSKKKSNE